MKSTLRFWLGTAALALALSDPDAHAAPGVDYDFEEIVVPGQLVTQPRGINSRGQIVGTYGETQASVLALEPLHGFLLDKGVLLTIDHPDSEHTFPTAISDNGIIVGYHGPWNQIGGGSSSPIRGFRLERGEFTPIAFGAFPKTIVNGVNNRGEVVGFAIGGDSISRGYHDDGDGVDTEIPYPGAQSTYLADVNEPGEILGFSDTGVGFILARGEFTVIQFPGEGTTGVTGMNNRGDVVGGYFDGQDGTIHGYVLSHGVYTTVDFPGGAQTQIRSINERGDIVGDYFTGTGETRGFIGRLRHGQ